MSTKVAKKHSSFPFYSTIRFTSWTLTNHLAIVASTIHLHISHIQSTTHQWPFSLKPLNTDTKKKLKLPTGLHSHSPWSLLTFLNIFTYSLPSDCYWTDRKEMSHGLAINHRIINQWMTQNRKAHQISGKCLCENHKPLGNTW